MRGPPSDLLHGTLDLLVLKALSLAPMHGWGISQRIQQLSRDAFCIGQGSLYPAVYRLERKGHIVGEWGTTENNREARYYRLTAAGRRALGAEVKTWNQFAEAVGFVIGGEA
ncbi:MAG TPA: PadR family transcriptional regulator [Gemmatimonadaceae bacterium]